MLAQDTPFAPTLAALVAALVAAGPLSVAVTKVVDFIRNLFDGSNRMPSWVWNVAALVVGLLLALGWGLNVMGALVATVPALAESDALSGTAGTILTGLFIGTMAGFWHEKMDEWSARADESHAIANASAAQAAAEMAATTKAPR